MTETGKIIKSRRKGKGLSTYELANLTEVSHTAIANIESGKTKNISIYLAQKIAKALDCSLSQLFPSVDFSRDGETEKFEKEIEKLKKQLEEKDSMVELQKKTICALEKQSHLLRFHFSNYWVVEKENLLASEKDPQNKGIISANINDSFAVNLMRGIISHEEIQSIIGTEGLFPQMKKWYSNFCKKK